MKARLAILCALTGLWGLSLKGQNLVSNPSFENYTVCPTAIGQVTYATGWTSPVNHMGSPDYLNVCGPATISRTDDNYFGNQVPNSGNAYIGIATWYQTAPQFREYVQTQLTSPLVAGTTYQVSMYVSLGDKTSHLTDGIQVHFRNSPISGSGTWNPLPVTPQVIQPTGSVIGDKTQWTLFSRTFVATGGEQYMVIGNFDNDASTATQFLSAGTFTAGYYYIDDVSLDPATTLQASLLDYNGTMENSAARIFWKTTNEQQVVSYEVQRSTDLISFETIGQLTATGATQNVSDYLFTDLAVPQVPRVYYRIVSVNMQGQQGFARTLVLEPVAAGQFEWAVYPNPVRINESVTLSWDSPVAESISFILTDLSGREIMNTVLEGEWGHNEFALPSGTLAPGTYLLNAKGRFTRFTEKLVVNH